MLDRLPVDVIARVLSHVLPEGVGALRLSPTSRAFRQAAALVLAQQEFLDLKAVPALTSAELALLGHRARCLRRIELDCWNLNEEDGLIALPAGLETLTLTGADREHHGRTLLKTAAQAQDGGALSMLHKLQITSFSSSRLSGVDQAVALAGTRLTSFALDGDMCASVINPILCDMIRHCPNLTHLSTYNIQISTLTFLEARSAKRGSQLQHLSVKYHRSYDDVSFDMVKLDDNSLRFIVQLFPKLSGLELIEGDTGRGPEEPITTVGIESLMLLAGGLRVLKMMKYCPRRLVHCSTISLMQLAMQCREMEEIHLNFPCFHDSVIFELISACGIKLKAIGMDNGGITGASLKCIAENCPLADGEQCVVGMGVAYQNITHISIKWTRRTSGDDLKTLAHCPRLEILNAAGSKGIWNTSMIPIISGECTRLRVLVLNHGEVTDATLAALAQSKSAQSLREIALHFCEAITCDGVQLLASGCRNLQCASFSCTVRKGVGDRGMQAIAQHCRGLTKLRLDSTCVTDLTMVALATHCKSLRNLNLKNCEHITEEGYLTLKSPAFPSLRTLGMGMLEGDPKLIWKPSRVFFCQLRPELKVVGL